MPLKGPPFGTATYYLWIHYIHIKKGHSALVLSLITPKNTPGKLRILVHLSGEINPTAQVEITSLTVMCCFVRG